MALDPIVYTNKNAKIANYYTEYAQNVKVGAFPSNWLSANYSTAGWSQPSKANAPYKLGPARSSNEYREMVAPASIRSLGNNTYTIDFGRMIQGDFSLTSRAGSAVTIQLGEELSGGRAAAMRTGNHYTETWTYSAAGQTFTGQSLKSFRYATISGYKGGLAASNVRGVSVVAEGAAPTVQVSTGNALLDRIAKLGEDTYAVAGATTVTDSISRERRPYEGDHIVVQELAYATGTDYANVRNTWDYLLANPTHYTEYRLMGAIGVERDFEVTGDVQYASRQYAALQNLINTVRFDAGKGLVVTNAGTADLVDWPRTETVGYNFSATRYKTAVNAVAYEAYRSMATIAQATGHSADAATYTSRANAIKRTVTSRLFDQSSGRFYDGLDANGRVVSNRLAQNSYLALAFGLYTNQDMADRIAAEMVAKGGQDSGSIYMAYFYYAGLVNSGHADTALAVLANSDTGRMRSYARVINKLHATMAPEAWDPSIKTNMTFSHPWGAGGSIAVARGVLTALPAPDGTLTVRVGRTSLADANVSVPTPRGAVTGHVTRTGAVTHVALSIPGGGPVQVALPTGAIAVDGQQVTVSQDGPSSGSVSLTPGEHEITITGQIALTATAGRTSVAGADGQVLLWPAAGSLTQLAAVPVDPNQGGVELRVHSTAGNWTAFSTAAGKANTINEIAMRLTGAWADQYNLYYRVATDQNLTLGWAQNGAPAGTTAPRGTITGIEVRLVAKGDPAPAVLGNAVAGTTNGADTLVVRRGNVYHFKQDLNSGVADRVIVYGRPTDETYVGDWDGDGVDSLAVRRGNTFYISNGLHGGEADAVVSYGRATDTVLVGDWDGNGRDTLAVRRGNLYYMVNTIHAGEADLVVPYGKPTDAVLVGDWDANETDTLTVRRGNLYYINNAQRGGSAQRVIAYGRPNDAVLVGDWRGDGPDTFAVRRGNAYYFRYSITSGVADKVQYYGRPNDTVMAGYFFRN
ncbi:family 78 glycoside hydrolase catalytic domain [Neoactinobaculum massilliense]|uniref:family 78 glycoside hydrolase catalytic domain n=1 Tax=Neoactinobaculum massilliense TaxID=2364794 RepID=UPI000F530C37|nr:family 78 glycoside hydrolase catalytic domain [Neoactinobaculum massilliense]